MKLNFYIIFILLGFTVSAFQSNTKVEGFEKWKQYSPSIAGLYGGELNGNELLSIFSANRIDEPKVIKGCNLKIKSFTYLHIHLKALPVYRELVNGNMMPATVKAKIGDARPGDYLIFDNILAECTQTNEVAKLPSIVFSYDGTAPSKAE